MKINSKIYKTNQTKNLIKTTSLFFIYNGANRKASDWITAEQELKNIHFEYYNVCNKIALKIFNHSTFKNFKPVVNGLTFFIKPSQESATIKKKVLLNNFEVLLFKLLALKLNNKIYSTKHLNKIYTMNYKTSKILLCQFGVTNLKMYL